MVLDGSNVNLFVAFAGGVVTFFASCLLPLVPTYLAYLTALPDKASDDDDFIVKNSKKNKYNIVLINSILFTAGFILVFVILGLTAGIVGNIFSLYRNHIQKAGGLFLILLGIFMLGLVRLPFLSKERRFAFNPNLLRWQKLNAVLLGITFGFAWSPCIGPVLSVILLWASQAETALKGALLLFVYGTGLGIPFILIGLFYEHIRHKIFRYTRFSVVLNKIGAVLIIFTGILLITEKLGYVFNGILNLLNMHFSAV